MYEWILILALEKEPNKEPVKKQQWYYCQRWTWTGDVFERRVICLEWKKKEQ